MDNRSLLISQQEDDYNNNLNKKRKETFTTFLAGNRPRCSKMVIVNILSFGAKEQNKDKKKMIIILTNRLIVSTT